MTSKFKFVISMSITIALFLPPLISHASIDEVGTITRIAPETSAGNSVSIWLSGTAGAFPVCPEFTI